MILGLAMALLRLPGGPANAQNVQHLTSPQPGGMPGRPVMTGVTRVPNGVSVTWDGTPGSAGDYQLFQTRSLKDPSWLAVGTATPLHQATITAPAGSAFFRVSGPPPVYAGVETCEECHLSTINLWINTPHAHAFKAQQATNDAYLYSHTVGYGLPTGFRSAAATPKLENVQCENCHGPAANHAANYIDPTVRPRVDLAATVCGGCHTGPQHPIYDEWTTSGHALVPGQSAIPNMNPPSRIDACGRCHSGSARLSLLQGAPLPEGDANVPIVCITCHDPHQTTANPAQLLYPLTSTADYSMSASGSFASQYNPQINVCAQCHNERGASWTNWSEPPHQSLQYNMLLGTIGELASGTPPNQPGAHSELEKQCVSCHMQIAPYQSEAKPAITGHSVKMQLYDVCIPCHDDQGQGLVKFMNTLVSNRVFQVTGSLDLWAITKAPAELRSYGTRAWEYANPGGLSSGGPGPTNATLQALIPVNIQKARFDLYSVYNDGSGGVHNPFFILDLLDTAEAWVRGELNKPR